MAAVDEAKPAFKARSVKAVGIIGLSDTGRAIAKRLVTQAQSAGIERIVVFDSDKTVIGSFGDEGVTRAKSVAHLVDAVDLTVLCLGGDVDVGKMARSHEGLLDCMLQGQIVIDHSWSSLALTRQLETAFAARGAAFLDAPIGQSKDAEQAIARGNLDLTIGGEQAAIDAASRVLGCFADKVTPIGQAGSAQVVRQVSDLVAVQTFMALAESMVTAGAVGVEADRLLEALSKRVTNNDLSRGGLASIRGGASSGRPTITDAYERLEAAMQLAESKNIHLDGAGGTLGQLREAKEKGLGDKALGSLFQSKQKQQAHAAHRRQP